MTEIRFYHLQRQKPLQALVSLIERARNQDQVVLIRAENSEEAEGINTYLWTYQPQSFLAHGGENDPFPESQKVFIGPVIENKNKATTLFQINSAALEIPDGILLCCKIFDGTRDAEIAAARADWKSLKERGYDLSYWQQEDDGKWSQKA